MKKQFGVLNDGSDENRMIGFEADEDGMGQRMEVDDEGIIWESDKYVQTNER